MGWSGRRVVGRAMVESGEVLWSSGGSGMEWKKGSGESSLLGCSGFL